MDDKRPNYQLVLAFMYETRGEAPKETREGTESFMAKRSTESPPMGEQLMEEVCEREDCKLGTSKGQQRKRWCGRRPFTSCQSF